MAGNRFPYNGSTFHLPPADQPRPNLAVHCLTLLFAKRCLSSLISVKVAGRLLLEVNSGNFNCNRLAVIFAVLQP